MKKNFIVSVCFLIAVLYSSIQAAAQKFICRSTIDWKALKADPKKYEAFLENEKWIATRIKERGFQQQSETVHEIPVVFHIVLADPGVVTNTMIFNQLEKLNLYFSGANTDPIPAYFKIHHGGVNFRFVLATQDPDGCSTNGINRKVSNLEFTSDFKDIKYTYQGGVDQWRSIVYNYANYLNIWVGKSKADPEGRTFWGEGISPFEAIDPTPPAEHGVYIDYRMLTGNHAEFNQQKALIHEIGHYFNLIHIWGDDNDCSGTDGVQDTPNQKESTSGICPTGEYTDECSPGGSFDHGIMYQNFMDYANDACKTMFTKGQAARMLQSLNFPNRKILISPDNLALKPSRAAEIFTSCNAPAFTSNIFKTIAVGQQGVVWAGTANQGLYQYNKNTWRKWDATLYQTVNYQDMKADQDGTIWVAQSGINGTQATNGGVLNFADTTFTNYFIYTPLNSNLHTRNARSLYIDTSRYNDVFGQLKFPTVWSAHYATTSPNVSGGLAHGLYYSPPYFTKFNYYIDSTNNSGGIFCIGGDSTEIWAYASSNYGRSQVLKYRASNNGYLGFYDYQNGPVGLVSTNFIARAIYFDANGNKWITISGEGLLVNAKDGSWNLITFPVSYPSTPVFNLNALTGNQAGDVFIGTTTGLIVYKGGYPMDEATSYRRYTTIDGLPGNNILGISIDTLRKRILLATDGGIAFWNPACSGDALSKVYYTTSAGDLGNASTWCQGEVPKPNSEIVIKHPITITTNTTIKKATVVPPGGVSVSTGVHYNITGQ